MSELEFILHGMSCGVDSLLVRQACELFFVFHSALKGETGEISNEIIGNDFCVCDWFQFPPSSSAFGVLHKYCEALSQAVRVRFCNT
jgi:hypothetical protein